MPTLGEFYDDLRKTIARGTSTDAQMKTWTRQAIKHLERNNSFDYMRDYYLIVPEPDSTYMDLGFEGRKLKAVEHLGVITSSGQIGWSGKMGFQGGYGAHNFGGYAINKDRIFFNGMVPGSPGLLLLASFFSSLPEKETETHPLLELSDDCVKWQVMVYANARDKAAVATWAALRDEALRTTLTSDDEFQKSSDLAMEYRGGSDGRLVPPGSGLPASIYGMFNIEHMFGVAGMFLIGEGAVTPSDGQFITAEALGQMNQIQQISAIEWTNLVVGTVTLGGTSQLAYPAHAYRARLEISVPISAVDVLYFGLGAPAVVGVGPALGPGQVYDSGYPLSPSDRLEVHVISATTGVPFQIRQKILP